MDTSLSQLRSSRECTQFAEKAEAQGNTPLAAEAHQRAIMAALHEYERALRRQGGGTHSGYLRRMLKQSGIVPAIDHLVGKEHASTGYHRVLEIGRADLAFEAVVLRYPGKFSPETVEQARERLAATRGYWWVNHKQTYRHEVHGGYLWSPKTNKNGSRNLTYDHMALVQPGDTVFSYAATHIRAIGIVKNPATSERKPHEFGRAGKAWSNKIGWRVDVDFTELPVPLRPREHMKLLADLLPESHSPIRKNGMGNQGVYLAHISSRLAQALRTLLGKGEASPGTPNPETERRAAEESAARAIARDPRLKRTTKKRLMAARVGQGEFRKNVESIELCCRVTGISDRRFLRASHIRPWCKSNNRQRLDGNNGLLLAPHIDHLFDRGYISFTDQGEMLLSPQCDTRILQALGLQMPIHVGPFNELQCTYLKYHRQHEFKRR